MNKVSHCCHREIIARIHLEYPLGGSRWSIPYKYDACAGCGIEVEDYIDVCEICGDGWCECEKKLMWLAKEVYERENFGLPFDC